MSSVPEAVIAISRPSDEMSYPSQASFDGLPVELRLRVYDFLFADDPLTVTIHGTAEGAAERTKQASPALRLLKLVNRKLYCETYSLRPSVSQITFVLCDCTSEDVEAWLAEVGIQTTASIRRLTFESWAGCFGEFYRNDGHMVWCDIRIGAPCNFGCWKPTDNKLVQRSRRGLCRRAISLDLNRAHYDIAHAEPLREWRNWTVENQLLALTEWEHVKTQLCGHEFLTSDICRTECGKGIYEVLRLIVRNARGGDICLSKPDLMRLFEMLTRSKQTKKSSKRRSWWDMATEAAITMVENAIIGD